MGMHPAIYIGVVMLLIGGWMFAFTFGSRTVGRDTCWIMVVLGIVTTIYGTFAGRKSQLTGSGTRRKDHYV
jgi:uncharacterized membrane protein HdeD (DUF308 family)